MFNPRTRYVDTDRTGPETDRTALDRSSTERSSDGVVSSAGEDSSCSSTGEDDPSSRTATDARPRGAVARCSGLWVRPQSSASRAVPRSSGREWCRPTNRCVCGTNGSSRRFSTFGAGTSPHASRCVVERRDVRRRKRRRRSGRRRPLRALPRRSDRRSGGRVGAGRRGRCGPRDDDGTVRRRVRRRPPGDARGGGRR
ncbi:hypothetical protein D8S78_01210 [Natrialba swarupiae]|nr:hypothetical protein [Natrialba swarupiae]